MSKKMKDFNRGLCIGQELRSQCEKEDMLIIRSMLGSGPENISQVKKYFHLDFISNREMNLGIWIVLK